MTNPPTPAEVVQEREAFEKWAREEFVCSEHSFVYAHQYGYINTVQSQTFGGRIQPHYANVSMLWSTWRAAAGKAHAPSEVLRLLDDALAQYMSLPARGFVADARAALSAQAAERQGWQWVPKDPTYEMLKAGSAEADPPRTAEARRIPLPDMYRAMLAAAPQPPTSGRTE